VLHWYESAEKKARILLTIDGAFLSFLSASLASGDLDTALEDVTPVTWALVGLTFLSLVGSLFSVVLCLVSRRAPSPADEGPPAAANMRFFEMVGRQGAGKFRETVKRDALDGAFETDALLSQISILSRNVTLKHAWVNFGFVFTGAAFLFLAGAIATHTSPDEHWVSVDHDGRGRGARSAVARWRRGDPLSAEASPPRDSRMRRWPLKPSHARRS
jgi:Family of unknown function (DUF5706)